MVRMEASIMCQSHPPSPPPAPTPAGLERHICVIDVPPLRPKPSFVSKAMSGDIAPWPRIQEPGVVDVMPKSLSEALKPSDT